MIKRSYFIHARKSGGDSGTYSYNYFILTRTSWLPDGNKAFDAAFEIIKEHLADKPGDQYEVIAFSRC